MADNGCDELDRLMADLTVQVPGATPPLIKMQLFSAIDWHLRRTNAWRYETDVMLQQGATQYPIFPPASSSMVRVLAMTQQGRAISPASDEAQAISQRGRLTADTMFPDSDAGYFADNSITEGSVLRYAVYWPTYVEVDVPPTKEAAIFPLKAVISLTLAPECNCNEDTDDSCGWSLEPWMYERYHDEWLWGTLSRLQGMGSKPWSNPQLALFNGKRAFGRASFSKQEAERGFVYDAPRWRYPRWA